MELYILDSLLRREQVVDKFESLIWTERFSSNGDFDLSLKSTLGSRTQFLPGVRLAMNKSLRVMTVETVTNSTDSEGKAVLNVKGRSLETILEDRVAKDTLSNTATEPKWVLTGTPGNIARAMFNDICVTGNLDVGDIIPFMMPGTIYPTDTIPEPLDVITWSQDLSTLYDAIKKICDLYDLGFRLVRNFDTSQLYFNIYAGNDRTTKQILAKPVIFAVDFDNLKNTTEFFTMQKAKNVAYVFSDFGYQVVYPADVDPSIDGFERHVLLVTAHDVDANTPNLATVLLQQGREALMASRGFSGIDGELDQSSVYRYGVDYELGDLVEMRSIDGAVTYKRVTEQIFVSDSEGERSYPTLAMNPFVTTNTWVSWSGLPYWEDLAVDEYWVDQ